MLVMKISSDSQQGCFGDILYGEQRARQNCFAWDFLLLVI